MAFRDGLDNPALAGLVGQFTWCPVADGTVRCLRWLTGEGDDLAPLLSTEGGRRPRPHRVLEAFWDGAALAFEPVTAPAPDRSPCGAEAACHVGGRQARRQ